MPLEVMSQLRISHKVLEKLAAKHKVERREVEQCFENKCGTYLLDDREDHKSDPPTLWFVAPTNKGRSLKIVFIYRDGNLDLRSAFDADAKVQEIYGRHAR
jgi:hypothetical protein